MRKNKEIRTFAVCILALVLSLAFILPFMARPVRAAGTTYKVRIYSGERGNYSGKSDSVNEVKVFKGLKYGDEFNFNSIGLTKNTVKLTDDKYYVRGFRESAKDNNTVGPESFTVTGDIDYVVAYGIAGSTVEYYVNYVDEAGNKLAESDTYYGNVGDKPVVAYEYIDGYYPQARNLTKTLSANASANNFTFVYRKIQQETTTSGKEQTTQSPAATNREQEDNEPETNNQTTIIERNNGNNGNNGNQTNTPADNNETGPTAAATTAAPAGDTGIANTEDMPDNPDEVPDLVDIDDQETPLADFDGSGDGSEGDTEADVLENDTSGTGLSMPAKIGIGLGSVAAIAAAAGALYYFLIYRSEDDQDDEDEQE